MPLLKGAASDVTVYQRVNATNNTDPEKKSRTFVATNPSVITTIIRASAWTMPVPPYKVTNSPAFNGRVYIT